MTNKRLDKIDARIESATEGAWKISSWRDSSSIEHMVVEPESGVHTIGDITNNHQGNAEFVAHARTDLPDLVFAMRKIMELHKPRNMLHIAYGPITVCSVCDTLYPCQTRRLVDELEENE